MKKFICLMTAIALVFAMISCGNSQTESKEEPAASEAAASQEETAEAEAAEPEAPAEEPAESGTAEAEAPAGEWTRTGYFSNENEDMLSITWSDLEGYVGWWVGFMIGDDFDNSYGNLLEQEGNTLHGNIMPDYEEGEMIVTVSEEGEDGVVLVVDGGETYHFTPMEMEEASISVTVSTEGWGKFDYVEGDVAPDPEEEPDWTYAIWNLNEPETYSFTAWEVEGSGWVFKEWVKDGEDFSTDKKITIEMTETADYVAVFEFESDDMEEEDGQNPVMNFIGPYAAGRANALVEAEGMENARVTIKWGNSAWSHAEWVMSGKFDWETKIVEYSDCVMKEVTYNEAGEPESEVVQYENGTGRFIFSDGGSFVWQDDQSDRGDLEFEWAWDPDAMGDTIDEEVTEETTNG